jgi:hypothetical protein
MNTLKTGVPLAGILALAVFSTADAGEVGILAADFQGSGANQ